MATIRIVVCLDIEAETPFEAYEKLHKDMPKLYPSIDWESTDEWFDADGKPVPEAEVLEARQAMFGRIPAFGEDESPQ